MFSFLIVSAFAGTSLWAAESTAKFHGILMNAESSLHDNDTEISELEGNVQIVFQGQHIKADKARVFKRTRQVELIGHVEIMDSKKYHRRRSDFSRLRKQHRRDLQWLCAVRFGEFLQALFYKKSVKMSMLFPQQTTPPVRIALHHGVFPEPPFALSWAVMHISKMQCCASVMCLFCGCLI